MNTGELVIVELKITIRAKTGEVFKVDMNNETQKIMLSMLSNFFKPEIPFQLQSKFEETAEELWDEESRIIDDNISSMETFVGTEVINKREFIRICSNLKDVV